MTWYNFRYVKQRFYLCFRGLVTPDEVIIFVAWLPFKFYTSAVSILSVGRSAASGNRYRVTGFKYHARIYESETSTSINIDTQIFHC